MKKIMRSAFVGVLMIVLNGCTDNPVSLVKKGTMNQYKSTTIGKAFEASFDEAKMGIS